MRELRKVLFYNLYLRLCTVELWNISQERCKCVIYSDCQVVEVHQEDNQDLIAPHPINGCGDPLFYRIRLHFNPNSIYHTLHIKALFGFATLALHATGIDGD